MLLFWSLESGLKKGFLFLLLTLTGGGAAEDAAAGGREPPGRGAAPSPSSWAHRTPDNIVGAVVKCSAANQLIGEVVQSRRRPLLGPSPG